MDKSNFVNQLKDKITKKVEDTADSVSQKIKNNKVSKTTGPESGAA